MKIYDVCVKLIKMLKRAKINFDGNFYTKNLANKKNNNDFMICAMLEVKFCVKPINTLSASYTFAADYLDMENSLNKNGNNTHPIYMTTNSGFIRDTTGAFHSATTYPSIRFCDAWIQNGSLVETFKTSICVK